MAQITAKIAVLVSGSGTNMAQLIKHNIAIDCVIADRQCSALSIAQRHGIATFQLSRKDCSDKIDALLSERAIDLVVLAGFLSILDKNLTEKYSIINIHPSLLPHYGGKGMYGMKVHQAVLESGERVSGATVHYVNEGVDTGEIIAQKIVDIRNATTAQEIASLVRTTEWELLPRVVKELCGSFER